MIGIFAAWFWKYGGSPKRKTWKHYKGGIYELVCYGEGCDDNLGYIVYRDVVTEKIWVRLQENFDAPVTETSGPRYMEIT